MNKIKNQKIIILSIVAMCLVGCSSNREEKFAPTATPFAYKIDHVVIPKIGSNSEEIAKRKQIASENLINYFNPCIINIEFVEEGKALYAIVGDRKFIIDIFGICIEIE